MLRREAAGGDVMVAEGLWEGGGELPFVASGGMGPSTAGDGDGVTADGRCPLTSCALRLVLGDPGTGRGDPAGQGCMSNWSIP